MSVHALPLVQPRAPRGITGPALRLAPPPSPRGGGTPGTEDGRNPPPPERKRKRPDADARVPRVSGERDVPYSVGRFRCAVPLSFDEIEKLAQCDAFYDDAEVEATLVPLITQRHPVSLRSLDWLVTNYAKKHNTMIARVARDAAGRETARLVSVYQDYDDWLRRHHRMKFDPFRRRKRIYFRHGADWHETTVGQCLFLLWCRTSGVLAFAERHVADINADMAAVNRGNRRRKDAERRSGHKRKRKELSRRPDAPCVVYGLPVRTRFELDDSDTEDDGAPRGCVDSASVAVSDRDPNSGCDRERNDGDALRYRCVADALIPSEVSSDMCDRSPHVT